MAYSETRRCVVHIGTHKTATTSIQRLLHSHRQELTSSGWLYPRAGRPADAPAGHHNLAWEISGDRRFRAGWGTAEALLGEIAGTDRSIIISSEDFECSTHHAERFEKFITAIRLLGIRVSLIAYLRNQIDYAESLYATLVMHGLAQPFGGFCDEILATGEVRWREWIFPFRYDTFFARLATLDDVEVIARSFDHPALGSTVLDFFSVAGRGEPLLSPENIPRENERPDLGTVIRRYLANQAETSVTDAAAEDIITSLRDHAVPRPSMSTARQARFVDAFEKSNQATCVKFGLPAFERMRRARLAAAAGPALDDIFGPDLRALSHLAASSGKTAD
jgi:hypothetical protein